MDFLSQIQTFLEQHPKFLLGLGLFSLLFFLASIILVPWIIMKLPTDYFSSERKRGELRMNNSPLLRVISLILKNIAGIFLILIGLLLLIIPGQGLLTIFTGILLMDFPGKYLMERRLLQSKVFKLSTTWLRAKNNKAPFIFGE